MQKGHSSEERDTTIAVGTVRMFIETKCQALTIARLFHSPYTTKIATLRCYMMLRTIFKCQWVKWENLGRLNTRCATAFWIRCKALIMEAGSPARSELQ